VLDVARKSLCTWLRQTSAAGAPRRDGRSVRPKLIESMEKSEVDSVVADALAWAPFILLGDPILGN
jgi:hypothetical protein